MSNKHTQHGVLAPVIWHITHIESILSPSCLSSNHLLQRPRSWKSLTNFVFLPICRKQQKRLKVFLLYDWVNYISCNHHVSFYRSYISSSLYFCDIESTMWIPQKREHGSSILTILSFIAFLL